MFQILLCLCFLQASITYFGVGGKREPLERFLVEEGSKPAIFGSYSYDPIKQVFETQPPDDNETITTSTIPDQIYNDTYVHSTAQSGNEESNSPTNNKLRFRQNDDYNPTLPTMSLDSQNQENMKHKIDLIDLIPDLVPIGDEYKN